MFFTNTFKYHICCVIHAQNISIIIINIHWNGLVEKVSKQYLHHLLSCGNIIMFQEVQEMGRNTRPGDIGSKTAKQLYNSYQICSGHFEDSQYMDTAHTSLMPHAISIDFIWRLRQYNCTGIDPTLPLTTMCGSSMLSCSLLLAAYECGNTSAAAVYDVRLTTVDITSLLPCITLVAPMDYLLCVYVCLCVSVFWR